jgi:hypothetical protein
MRVKDTFYSDVMILSKLNSRLIGNLLYLRNVEKITDINNEKINSLTIRYYHNMYETLITIKKMSKLSIFSPIVCRQLE